MTSIENLLTQWDLLEDVGDCLKNHRIDLESLKSLPEDDLKEIIPWVGTRNRFKAKWTEWKYSQGLGGIDSGASLTLRQLDGDHLSGEQRSLLREIADDVDALNREDVNKGPSPVPAVNPERDDNNNSSTGNTFSSESSEASGSDFEDNQSRIRPSGSKRSRVPLIQRRDIYDIEKVLVQSHKGKIVLNKAKVSDGKLNDSLRNSLAECLINYELRSDLDKRVSTARAKFLAQKVVEKFPNELLSTWYREDSRPENPDWKSSKGKILTKYYTVRRTLTKAGMIDGVRGGTNEEEDELEYLAEDDPDNSREALAWLEAKNLTSWPRVVSSWTATSKARLSFLHQAESIEQDVPSTSRKKSRKIVRKFHKKSSDQKVASYTEKYPQILQPEGWTLLEIDFERLHKDAMMKLSLEAPKFEKFVLKLLIEANPENLHDDMSDKARRIFSFLSLAKLFPVVTVGSTSDKKKQWRPSRQEVRDGFLLHLKVYRDLKKHLEERKKRLQTFGFSDQPLAVIIGTSLDNIEKSLVVLDSYQYEVENPLKAIDIVFKAYHALHAFYPVESDQLWHFLQKAVYKVKTKWDKQYERVDVLVAQYQKFTD